MARILRLNMARQSYHWEEVPPAYTGLGGRALTSRLIREEVDPSCHPLSAANKLVLAPGLLAGTFAASSGRLSVGGKSPLTGAIKEGNVGGTVSQKLARLHIKAVVLEGKPRQADGCCLVKISPEGVEFFPASEYEGLGNYRTMALLWKRFGRGVAVLSIGPAGEKCLTAASIQVSDPAGRPARAAGRGGLGALMGSKKLKALVVDDKGAPASVPLADPEGFKAAARAKSKYLTSGYEYETHRALEANTRIRHPDEIAQLDRLCDDLGLDPIEMGVTLGVLMEGGVIPWGSGSVALKMLKKVGKNDPWGLIIGNGSAFTGQALGLERVPATKGQALPACDRRAEKGVGLTRAASPMGGDHTAGYAVAVNFLQCGCGGESLKKEGNIEFSRNPQIATAAIDATGLCLSVAFPVLDNPEALQCLVDLINACYGLSLTTADVTALGRQILHDEKSFNREARFTRTQDRLPGSFKENLKPHNVTWDFTDEEIAQVLADL
ncbi:MAG: aldehyde ferredoxin oxidoreductase N-terminal domain-containing protein [Desulfobaccales bacterium]